MFKREYDQLIKEHFDLTDKNTRRYIVSLEDAGQEQLLSALSSALYDKIVSKVDDIDFGSIPTSRGDITKVDGFSGTEECLNIIRRLVLEYKQNPAIVDIVLTTIQNIKDRKGMFIKGFSLNSELPMLIYNMMVLSVERSTSLMIATCIEYVKDPKSSTPVQALNKVAYQRTMDDLLFKQLANFNNMCKTKDLDKLLESAMKNTVHEEVEYQYGTVTPISEEDPEEATPGVESDPVPDSAQTPGNTVDLFGDDTADMAPQETPHEELTGDTEIPAPNEFPEDVPEEDYAPDECGPAQAAVAVVQSAPDTPEEAIESEPAPKMIIPTPAVQDIEVDPEETPSDDVEPENIPVVTPSDDITPDNPETINEEEPVAAPADVQDVQQQKEEEIENDIDNEFDDKTQDADNGVAILPQGIQSEAVYPGDKDQGALVDVAGKGLGKGIEWLKGRKWGRVVIAIGAAALISGAVVGAVKVSAYFVTHAFIPFLRNIVYMHYYTRMKVSDYLAIQADLLEANANELQYSSDASMDETQKDKVVKKQLKWVQRLRAWSNKFAIDNKESNNKSSKEIESESKEKKTIAKDDDGDDVILF